VHGDFGFASSVAAKIEHGMSEASTRGVTYFPFLATATFLMASSFIAGKILLAAAFRRFFSSAAGSAWQLLRRCRSFWAENQSHGIDWSRRISASEVGSLSALSGFCRPPALWDSCFSHCKRFRRRLRPFCCSPIHFGWR